MTFTDSRVILIWDLYQFEKLNGGPDIISHWFYKQYSQYEASTRPPVLFHTVNKELIFVIIFIGKIPNWCIQRLFTSLKCYCAFDFPENNTSNVTYNGFLIGRNSMCENKNSISLS